MTSLFIFKGYLLSVVGIQLCLQRRRFYVVDEDLTVLTTGCEHGILLS